MLPWTAAVPVPPNWDRRYTECFGFTLEDLGEEGAASIEQKLRAIGLPVDTLPRFPMPMDLPPRERALRGQKMLHAGLIGPADEGVHADDDALAIWFDQIARQADATAVRPGTTIAWDFTDAPPWTLTLDGTRATATQAPAPGADLTLRTTVADFADVTAGRADARRLMLQRRLRPRGSVRLLLALPRVLG